MRTLLHLLLSVALLPLEGYVIMYTWNNVVPQTFGAAPITVMQSIGLGLLLSAFVATRDAVRSLSTSKTYERLDDDEKASVKVGIQYIACAVTLIATMIWVALAT